MKKRWTSLLIQLGLSSMVILTLTTPVWAHGDETHGETTHKQSDALHHEPEVSAVERADGIHGHAHTHVREADCLVPFAEHERATDLDSYVPVVGHDDHHDEIERNIQQFSAVHRHITHAKSRITL